MKKITKHKDSEIKYLQDKANCIRQLVFKAVYQAGGGHIPASLSIAELLSVLYFRFLNLDPNNPQSQERDRFILSKGHGCVALYAALAEKGFFPKEWLLSLCKKGGKLGGHPDMQKVPGVDASTGSLGHGFPFAAGVAFSAKLNKKKFKVYTLLGDGECMEGSIWEAAIFASHHKLDNLIAIVDHNRLCAIDFIDNVASLAPFADKWRAFGWEVREVDGHNIGKIIQTLKKAPFKKGKPSLILANTVKGKGISFMENVPIWHFRMTNDEELKVALRELGLTKEELNKI